MSLFSPSGFGHGSRQRGAISVIAAVGIGVVVAATLLAVDFGNLVYTRRELQTVADMAALSAANDISRAQAIAENTAGLNNFPAGGGPGNSNTVETVVGQYDFGTHAFVEMGGEDWNAAIPTNAVKVTVTTQEPYFFTIGSHRVTATATATRTDMAGFSLGTGLLSIDTQRSALLNALLGKLLNTSLSLDAVSYTGLANANVSLLDLVHADADVGTVDELLNSDISVRDLLSITATALTQSSIATVDATVINTLNLLSAQVPADLQLRLGDLVKLAIASPEAAAAAKINVLQLVSMAAEVANGRHFLENVLDVDLGLAKLNLGLSLIEPPTIAYGPPGQDDQGNWLTQAHSAQGRVTLKLSVLSGLNGLGSGLIDLPLYVELAAADAHLESIECRMPRDESIVTIGANSSVSRIYIGDVNPDAMTNTEQAATVSPATIINVLGLIKATVKLGVDLPGGADTLEFTGPFDMANTQRISGLSTAGLADSLINKAYDQRTNPDPQTVLLLTILGIPLDLSALLDFLMPLLQPVLSLLDSLLNPVLSLLGIQLGYADVTNFSLSCGNVQLVR